MTQVKTRTERTHSPYRYDIVGSFLRPQTLKEARDQFKNGLISKADLKAVEDREIIKLIEKQEAAGLKAVTDGEFRRSWWSLDFFWGLQGIEKADSTGGYQFDGVYTRAETAHVKGKITGENHPFVDHFKFTRDHTSKDVEVKQTIPAPAQLIAELQREENLESTQAVYASLDDLIEAVSEAYIQVIHDLYRAGARTIQFDDCTWGSLVSDKPEGVSTKIQAEVSTVSETEADQVREKLKKIYIRVNNQVTANKPADLVINTHVCRGNYNSKWASSGAYDAVASPLFDQGNYNAYYLEYDSERAGSFAPLSKVTEGKSVVLGLITTKDGQLEDRQQIIDRIYEAAEFISLENLYLSPQCGFASTEEGNVLSEDQQWAKIALVKSIAEEVWGV